MKEIYKAFTLGDMRAVYLLDTETRVMGLTVIPEELAGEVDLDGWWNIEPAVQIKLVGTSYPDGFSNGHSMRNSADTRRLRFCEQKVETDGKTRVITIMENERAQVSHVLEYEPGQLFMKMYSEVTPLTEETLGIEMISSYNLCAFSCLGKGLRMEDFVLHRLCSKWSMEGRLESVHFMDMQLEPSWLRIGANSVRFGQVGSMPVRRYFPWMIAEDEKYGYGVGIQLCHPASWQMEVYNIDERFSLSGGLADREFGHWMKNLKNGETFRTPVAVVTTAKEDVDGISYRLTSAQLPNLDAAPESERDLPVVFNEYCKSWGRPTQDEMLEVARTLKGHGIRYCVIDAGWHVRTGNDWSDIGDWNTNRELFPDGLAYTAEKIREAGMIPGLWYEMENVAGSSDIFNRTEYLLHRDGYPLQAGARRFLDMRKPEVWEYLEEKVIRNLKECGFGYLKVDYNDNIGIGCDGAESLGEGLRQNMEKTREFFARLRQELPDLVIENCSSGGHRLEPSMQALSSMASFSDAHECQAIPVIAANVSRAILPAQSQIWAVLRKNDSEQRLYYSLCNTFLGRMCLSGDVCELDERQWKIVDEGIGFYKSCAPLIRMGRNYRQGTEKTSYNHLKGWQAVCRLGAQKDKMLAVVHGFEECGDGLTVRLPAPDGQVWTIGEEFHREGLEISCTGGELEIRGWKPFDAAGVILEKSS